MSYSATSHEPPVWRLSSSSSKEISWCVCSIEGDPSSEISLIEREHTPWCPMDDCERMLSTRSPSSSVPVVHRPNMHIDAASVSTTLSKHREHTRALRCQRPGLYLVYIFIWAVHGPSMRSKVWASITKTRVSCVAFTVAARTFPERERDRERVG